MSNKAIVFYTGELLEVQENSLREVHGVENIIFVPVESMDDLNTKILETTEQPFTVYNYLTDPDLIIAVCDKLSTLTAETGFLPEYFIWVEEIETNHRKEISKMPTNTSRVIIITEATLANSLNLKKEEVNESVDVISINIPASSEEHVKQVFNDKVFRGYTKPTLVLIDDRHKYANVIADLVKVMNVYNNINVKIIDMRDHSLTEILKKQADLEVKERFEEMKATQIASLETQYNKPGELHVDVSGIPMPESVKAVKERVENFDALQKRNNARESIRGIGPYLSYGEAIEMCKNGVDVACVNWKAGEFLTVNTGLVVHADNFWSPGNKRVAMSNPDQSLSVFPHFLRTTEYGTIPHMVDFNDQFSEWVVASDRVKVKRATVNGDEGLLKLTLHYALDTFSTAEFELAPFWIVYDVLAKLPHRVTVIGDNPKSELPHIVGSMKEAHDYRRQIVEESYQIDEDGIDDDMYPHRGVEFVCSIGLNDILKRIEEGEFKDVILDDDSIKTDLRLEKIKEALQRANVNWVTVSVKEQLFGITE